MNKLNLSENQHFQVSVFNFNKLKHLDLSKIKKFRLVDKLFENLLNLETLNLSSINNQTQITLNDLTFYGLFKLKQLDLSQNSLYHLKANVFKYLVHLTDLNLYQCHLLSVNRDTFCDLSELESLNLSDNSIEEMDEQHFRDLIKLKTVNLYKNPFIYRKDIVKFYNNLNLIDLDLIIDKYFD